MKVKKVICGLVLPAAFSVLMMQAVQAEELVSAEIEYIYEDEIISEDTDLIFEEAEILPDNSDLSLYETEEVQVQFTDEIEVTYELLSEAGKTVEQKVAEIAAECTASGAATEYEKAVWLHDWLTHNANYDYTYSIYGPEGVLLQGTGVCQSYTDAYSMLLDCFDIENVVVIAPEMDHSWNIVKLDGVYCHVDCTWDDPGTGGQEDYTYFGMSDELMAMDHQWDKSQYPACTGLSNYYPIKNGFTVVEDQEEMADYLEGAAAAQKTVFEYYYVGADASFNITEEYEEWFYQNDWKYGLMFESLSSTARKLTATVAYTDPWGQPLQPGEQVECPDFTLRGPKGVYERSAYTRNSMVLIFGSAYCGNTHNMLYQLNDQIPELNSQGIEVIMNAQGAVKAEDLSELAALYPNVTYTYGDSILMWDMIRTIGNTSGSITYPAVFVIDQDGMITYYSLGYAYNVNNLVAEAQKTATGNALPVPGEDDGKHLGAAYIYSGDNKALKKELRSQLDKKKSDIQIYYGEYNVDLLHDKVYALLEDLLKGSCMKGYNGVWIMPDDQILTIHVDYTVKHTYGDYKVTKEPTVSAAGEKTRKCTVCGNTDKISVPKIKVQYTMTLNADSLVLKTGQKTTALKVTGLAEGDSVASYKSSNKKIFTVSKSGKITAKKKAGSAKLTITLKSGLSRTITVKVQKAEVKTAKISGISKKVTLKKGKTYTLAPVITPITSAQKLTFTTSNKKVATVNSKGVITAKKKGTAKITVKSGSKKVTCTVKVKK